MGTAETSLADAGNARAEVTPSPPQSRESTANASDKTNRPYGTTTARRSRKALDRYASTSGIERRFAGTVRGISHASDCELTQHGLNNLKHDANRISPGKWGEIAAASNFLARLDDVEHRDVLGITR